MDKIIEFPRPETPLEKFRREFEQCTNENGEIDRQKFMELMSRYSLDEIMSMADEVFQKEKSSEDHP